MKGLKELSKKAQDPQSDSESHSQIQSSSVLQQSASESQIKSSDYVSVSNERVHDPNVGYDTGNYIMEKINFRRWNLQQKCFEYLIKWKGYSHKQCTWQTTEDILREPCLQLKDLDKDTLLPIFERTHGKTLIWDDEKKKVVKEFIHNEKNLQMYGSKKLIEEMKEEMEELYGQKSEQQKSQKNSSQSQVKIELDGILSEQAQSQNSMNDEEMVIPEGFRIGNIIVEKLIYFPQEFQLKIAVCLANNREAKKMLTCNEMMKIHPETALRCYKVKIAAIKKWKQKFCL